MQAKDSWGGGALFLGGAVTGTQWLIEQHVWTPPAWVLPYVADAVVGAYFLAGTLFLIWAYLRADENGWGKPAAFIVGCIAAASIVTYLIETHGAPPEARPTRADLLASVKAYEAKRAHLQGQVDYLHSNQKSGGSVGKQSPANANKKPIKIAELPKPTPTQMQQACFTAGQDQSITHNDMPGFQCAGPVAQAGGKQEFSYNSTAPIPTDFPPATGEYRQLTPNQLKEKLMALSNEIMAEQKSETDENKRRLYYEANFANPVRSVMGEAVSRYGKYPTDLPNPPNGFMPFFLDGERIAKTGRPSGVYGPKSVAAFLNVISQVLPTDEQVAATIQNVPK